MKLKTTLFKRKARNDRRKNKWVLRVKYFDEFEGRDRSTERQFDTRTAAVDCRPQLEANIRKTHGQIRKGDRMSFGDLAILAKRTFYKPAVILNGRKVDGIKSHRQTHVLIGTLLKYFKDKRIGQIRTDDLRSYREWRIKTVSITTINREFATMRRMMKHAFAEGWVSRDIFVGAKVIDVGAEKERKRILTKAEEGSLLGACTKTRQIAYKRLWKGVEREVVATMNVDNPYLKTIILLALDSGMRKGEILKLQWEDIDLTASQIVVVATNTKTERGREVPLTERTKVELLLLPSYASTGRVFHFNDFKRSWATANRIAGIEDLGFHDLRRTALTRWLEAGMPLPQVGKIAGHTQLQTTMKHYVAADAERVGHLTHLLNSIHLRESELAESTEFLN
jgi:integrase